MPLRDAQSLIFCLVFYPVLFVLLSFFFCHCIVCLSSINVFYYLTSDNVFSDWLTSLETFFDKTFYYIRLYFTVFLLARSNTRDIPFSNILISKKQFLCNRKAYCTLVQNQWMKLNGTRVQYGFLLHKNCFFLIKVRKFQKISKI